MHRIQTGRVSLSEFDSGLDFDPDYEHAETESYTEFTDRIRLALHGAKKRPAKEAPAE